RLSSVRNFSSNFVKSPLSAYINIMIHIHTRDILVNLTYISRRSTMQNLGSSSIRVRARALKLDSSSVK
ncbi:Unknown protein, partial [Striga hermonthica]